MNSAVGPSFKVVFIEKVLADPINSAWDPLKNVRHSCTIQTYTKIILLLLKFEREERVTQDNREKMKF